MTHTQSTAGPGWQFDNSYADLPEQFYARLNPTKVNKPELAVVNHKLATELGLTVSSLSDDHLAQVFSGNDIPAEAAPLSQAYAGHQFGSFTMLGDGRAHLLGEHVTPEGKRFDIQLKGSGRTPFGRRGDGRAALGPMLREYIISEAMHALNIPTTRSLAVVTTGEPVYRETALQGAVLTRVASSHLRVGTFEYVAALGEPGFLRTLADYAINRHYPELKETENPYLGLLTAVIERQIDLIINWLRVGFIHGVMNTDNMTISGETIDYGPCAFMDEFDPMTVFSSIDAQGRYAFANQSRIAQWNLARLAESLLPLFHSDQQDAISIAEEAIKSFTPKFEKKWLDMMRGKLGLSDETPQDDEIIGTLLNWMQRSQLDYTNTFRSLSSNKQPDDPAFETDEFTAWHQAWSNRRDQDTLSEQASMELMKTSNPAIIPRNHKVEEALVAAEQDSEFSTFNKLVEVLQTPYEDNDEFPEFQQTPRDEERVTETFCGT